MVCIGIALIFWLLVKLSQTYRTERSVSLRFALPEDKTFAANPPRDVRVQLEGSGWDLLFEYFSDGEIPLFYDLRGSEQLFLNRGQLRTDILNNLSSKDLKITEVNYDNIDLLLEEKARRTLPVILRKRLTFDPEYHLREPVWIEPDSVEITGPASTVELLQQWYTDSLVLTGLKTDKVVELPLETPPGELNLGITQVTARVEVEQFTEKSLFVPLTIRNAPDSLKIFPERIKLSCVVGLSQFNEVTADDFTVEVDLQNVPISEDKNTAPIQLTQQPAFVKNVKFSPKSAEFFILK